MEPVNQGITKPNTKATRKRLTFAQKLDILSRLENGEKPDTLAKDVGCSNRAISRLKQQRNFFKHQSLEPGETHRKSWHTSRNAELEKHLTAFLKSLKRTGFPIFCNSVRRAALRIRDELLDGKKTASAERVTLSGFQASANWAKAFLKRKRLRGRQSCNGDAVNGGDAVARDKLVERLKRYDLECVMAVESFNIFYKLLPSDMTGSSQAVPEDEGETWRRHDLKDRVVILVGCNTTGTFRTPGTMIWKKEKDGRFREAGCGMAHLYQRYALLDADVVKTWFVSVLLPGVRQFTRRKVGVIVPWDWPDGMVDKEGQVEIIKAEFWKDGDCGPLRDVSGYLRRKLRYSVADVLQRVWKLGSGEKRGFGGLCEIDGLMKGEAANLTNVSDLVGGGWRDVSEAYLRNCWIGCGVLGSDMKEELSRKFGEGTTDDETEVEGSMDGWLTELGVGKQEFDGWLSVEESARGVRGLCWEMEEIMRDGIIGKEVGHIPRLESVMEKSWDGCMPSLGYVMDLIEPIEMVLAESGKGKAVSLVRLLKMQILREYEHCAHDDP